MTIPQIDTSNITNAFVSGMKEDLDLYGNQYNYIVTSWTVGYIIGQWVCFFFSFYSSSVRS
jgi:ACS family pantothenate transporter-like MFS transporter